MAVSQSRKERTEDTSGDAFDILDTLYSALLTLAAASGIPALILAFADAWTAGGALAGIPIGVGVAGATVAASAAVVQWSKTRRPLRESTAAWITLVLALPVGVALGTLASVTLALG